MFLFSKFIESLKNPIPFSDHHKRPCCTNQEIAISIQNRFEEPTPGRSSIFVVVFCLISITLIIAIITNKGCKSLGFSRNKLYPPVEDINFFEVDLWISSQFSTFLH